MAENDNEQLNDEQRRSSGPKIDIIFYHRVYGLEIGVLEVSGQSNKIDRPHFVGDRNKICKNLTIIH